MPEHGETYASFAATHEVRLVRSVVSETGLPPATAARVVADVLPAAYERRFATPGAAYGWLRVAARHRAAGSLTWADAADTALGCADTALSALACLPAADRELLRLRYVEGLRTETVAERLGVPAATVAARLGAIHAAAACALPAAVSTPPDRGTGRSLAGAQRQALPVSLPRLATAAAAVAAAVVATGGPAPTPAPPVAGRPTTPYIAPSTIVVAGEETPVAASERSDRAVAVRAASAGTVVPIAPPARKPNHPPGGSGSGCQTECDARFFDEIHIRVPKDAAPAIGEEIVVPQEVASEHVRVCDAVEPLPRDHAYCERANQ